MKSSLFLLPICLLGLASCQNMPWSQNQNAVDPYAAGTGYPAASYPQQPANYPQQGYAAPSYDVSGEQAQVTPAGGAAPYAAPSQYAEPTQPKISSNAATGGSGRTYVVQKGDTLSKISKNKSTTVAKLMKANGLTSDVIRVGQTLKY